MRSQKINEIRTFLRRCKRLETTERYRSSLKGNRNTVAEHSWHLGLLVLTIGTECKVDIDMGHALSLALLHDIGEAETGDIDAYDQIMQGKKLIENKVVIEELAMRSMTNDISFGDWVYDLWREYEDQRTIEAKFVKALDKIEGFLHIAEVGVESYVPKEFHADYASGAVQAFDETTYHFPELKDFLDNVKDDLKQQFEGAGITWVEKKASPRD